MDAQTATSTRVTPTDDLPDSVLVIDDDAENLAILGRLLRPHYKVLAAPAGQRALAIVSSSPPDLILLDVLMPGMDGYAVLAWQRADPATRDPETGNHIRCTQEYVRILAERLKTHPQFSDFLTEKGVELLAKSAPLHDIGKVGIPDHILLKPGKLTEAEWAVMKTHSLLGARAIERAERDADRDIDFLDAASPSRQTMSP